MSLLAAVDEERFGLLKAEIVRATAERNSLEELPKIFEKLETAKGAVRNVVGILRGAISGNLRVSSQAARSIG
jgi:hypothetical protein